MVAVKGIYDGQVVRLLEPVKVKKPYQVEVTFLEEIDHDLATNKNNLEPFIGMWADLTPEEERTFRAILEERSTYFAGRLFDLEEKSSHQTF